MKKYYLLICLFATSLYAVAQPWAKSYDRVDACDCGLALVKKDGKFGFVTEQGKVVIPLIYDEALAFNEDHAAIAIGGKWGFIDKTGKEVIPYRYNYATSFAEGVARVLINTTWHTIDKEGNITKTYVMQ